MSLQAKVLKRGINNDPLIGGERPIQRIRASNSVCFVFLLLFPYCVCIDGLTSTE